MRKLFGFVSVLAFILGCSVSTIDSDPPGTPTGLRSITGDEMITLLWHPNSEKDLKDYLVYRNTDGSNRYERIAVVSKDSYYKDTGLIYYVDTNVSNGQTYYYAVSARDTSGNESPLSKEDVFDTPRLERKGIVLYEVDEDPGHGGLDISTQTVRRYNDPRVHLYFDYDPETGGYFLNVTSGNYIQDMGWTDSLYDIDLSPVDGWSNLGYAEAIEGHTYCIWTSEDRYAKVRLTKVTRKYVVLDCAYQPAKGIPELAPPKEGKSK